MPKGRSGTYYWNKTRTLAVARPRVHWTRKRPTYPMPNSSGSEEAADARSALVSSYAQRMSSVDPAYADRLLRELAAAGDLEVAQASTDRWIGGWRPASSETTVEQLGTAWTDGTLKKKHGIHVRNLQPRTADAYQELLRKWVYPVVGHFAAGKITLKQSDVIVERLAGSGLDEQSQRNVLSRFRTLMNYAVQPCRLRETSPLPPGWVPPAGEPKAKGMIYPDDDAQLLACMLISIHWRMFWGFLGHEGMRPHNVVALRISNVNLDKNFVRVDKSKTSARILFVMTPGTREAIRAYLQLYRPNAKPDDLLFVDDDGGPIPLGKLAEKAREHFGTAGILERRPELLKHDEDTKNLVAYDYRGSFITIKLAQNWSNKEIQDHTGHVDSRMIEKVYRRQAETMEQFDQTQRDWVPLIEAIPELQPSPGGNGSRRPLVQTNGPRLDKRSSNHALSLGLEEFSQDFLCYSQAPDMTKDPKVSRLPPPSSPVQPSPRGQTLANPEAEALLARVRELELEAYVQRRIAERMEGIVRDFASEVTPHISSAVILELARHGITARPKPTLVVEKDDEPDED